MIKCQFLINKNNEEIGRGLQFELSQEAAKKKRDQINEVLEGSGFHIEIETGDDHSTWILD